MQPVKSLVGFRWVNPWDQIVHLMACNLPVWIKAHLHSRLFCIKLTFHVDDSQDSVGNSLWSPKKQVAGSYLNQRQPPAC